MLNKEQNTNYHDNILGRGSCIGVRVQVYRDVQWHRDRQIASKGRQCERDRRLTFQCQCRGVHAGLQYRQYRKRKLSYCFKEWGEKEITGDLVQQPVDLKNDEHLCYTNRLQHDLHMPTTPLMIDSFHFIQGMPCQARHME